MNLDIRLIQLVKKIKSKLTSDLLHPKIIEAIRILRWSDYPYAGYCFISSEALYHLAKKYDIQLQLVRGKDPKTIIMHYWLIDNMNNIWDITKDQFSETKIQEIYKTGKKCNIFSNLPSKRAQILIDRIKLDA